MRSIAATMQVLAAVRGETGPLAPLTFDGLMEKDPGTHRQSTRRIVRQRPYDIASGRTARHPRVRPDRARLV